MNPIAPSDLYAFTAPRIFDGEKTWVDHAVLVENGVVRAIAPASQIPASARLWSQPGCTILPGLIDTHAHFMRWQGPLFLAYGVTTIRDTGNAPDWILERRGEWKNNLWPRLLCTGPLLDGPFPIHPWVSRRCASAAEAVCAVRETAGSGVDGIKLYVGLDPVWLPAMAAESHRAGLKISMHCGAGGVLAAAEVGVDESFHLDGVMPDVWPSAPPGWLELWGLPEFAAMNDPQRRLADEITRLGMTVTPTLAYWDSQVCIRRPGFGHSEEARLIPPVLIEWRSGVSGGSAGYGQWQRALAAAQHFVGLLLERGARVLAGSDTPCGPVAPGVSLWRELDLLTQSGMSPEQALRSATSAAADFLNQPGLGRLAAGSSADLVLVGGNPLEGIPLNPAILLVVQNGVVHHPQALLNASIHASQSILEDRDPWSLQFKAHRPVRTRRQPGEPLPPQTSPGCENLA